LTTQIDALTAHTQSQQLAALVNARATATAQITTLQQAVQTDNLQSASVANGSQIITPATRLVVSKKKIFGVDGFTGLAVGLILGLMIVVLQAVLSEKLRRREDIAAVLGTTVQLSIPPDRHHFRLRRRSVRAMAVSPDPEVQTLAQYLREQLVSRGPKATQMIVALDDVSVPAAAMASLANTMSALGKQVVLVDFTADRVLGRAFGDSDRAGSLPMRVATGSAVTILVPRRPWDPIEQDPWEYDLATVAQADEILVVATVDPAVGAWHLRTWAGEAVATVTAGSSTAHHISAVGELLEAAGVTVSSAVLLGADEDDDSVGIPDAPGVADVRRFGTEREAMAIFR
jgi:hypothetical protein